PPRREARPPSSVTVVEPPLEPLELVVELHVAEARLGLGALQVGRAEARRRRRRRAGPPGDLALFGADAAELVLQAGDLALPFRGAAQRLLGEVVLLSARGDLGAAAPPLPLGERVVETTASILFAQDPAGEELLGGVAREWRRCARRRLDADLLETRLGGR